MADFNSVLSKINTAAQIAAAAEPALEAYGSNHIAATQQILQIAGAGVAAESSDPNVQQEATSAATLASSLVPLVFGLISLFRKPKAS